MITMQALALETFVPMLRTLVALLDRGAEHARRKPFDVAVLAESPRARHVPAHVAITYAILRHVGVELGMRDWSARAGAYLQARVS